MQDMCKLENMFKQCCEENIFLVLLCDFMYVPTYYCRRRWKNAPVNIHKYQDIICIDYYLHRYIVDSPKNRWHFSIVV